MSEGGTETVLTWNSLEALLGLSPPPTSISPAKGLCQLQHCFEHAGVNGKDVFPRTFHICSNFAVLL